MLTTLGVKIVSCLGIGLSLLGYYPSSFTVIDVNEAEEVVTLMDKDGEMWNLEDSQGYEIGTILSAIMFDNHTESIFDDEIVMLYETGYVVDFD